MADFLSDSVHYFTHDPCTVFKASSILICTYIALRAEELVDHISAGCKDFNTIVPYIMKLFCCLGIFNRYLSDLLFRHLFRDLIVPGISKRTWSDHFLAGYLGWNCRHIYLLKLSAVMNYLTKSVWGLCRSIGTMYCDGKKCYEFRVPIKDKLAGQ